MAIFGRSGRGRITAGSIVMARLGPVCMKGKRFQSLMDGLAKPGHDGGGCWHPCTSRPIMGFRAGFVAENSLFVSIFAGLRPEHGLLPWRPISYNCNRF